MSVAPIKLTEPARKKIFKLLIILNVIQLILGTCSLIIGLHFYMIARHLHKSNRFYSSITVLYILSVGLMAIMLSVFGIKMSYNCSSKPFMKKMNSFHNSWIAFNFVSLILMISFLFGINKLFNLLLHLITDTFWHGISHYISDIAWKNTFDYFQNTFKCCGINTYTDWYTTPWIPLSFLPQDANTLSRFGRADGQVLFPILPLSCCRKNIVGSKCRIDVLEKLTTYIQPVPISEIYITGCIPLINRSLSIILISLMLISILITIVETSIIISGHYLYISTRNSLLMGIPNDAAPGWLFGRGDFGYRGGKTLFADNLEMQVMDDNVDHVTELKEEKSYRGLDMIKKKLKKSCKKYKVKHQLDSAISPVKEKLRKKLAKFKLHKKKKFDTKSENVTGTKKSEDEKDKLDKQKELSNNLEINEQNNKSKQTKINKKKDFYCLQKDQQNMCPILLNDKKHSSLKHKIKCNSDTVNNLSIISNHSKTFETNYNLNTNFVKNDDLSDILHDLGVS